HSKEGRVERTTCLIRNPREDRGLWRTAATQLRHRLVLPETLTDHYIGRTDVNWKAFLAIGFQSANERMRAGMIDEVYNKKILEFAGNIPRIGRLAAPDASARAHSKLCGSTVTVDLCMRDGLVTDFAHDVKACALGQASSSIMARNIIGASAAELRQLRETMQKMLRENGPPPEGRFADLRYLEPVRDYRARHASTLLTFD